ncbi:HAD-IC family P-type ATPase [Streptomyces albidoflavus]
MLTSLSRVLERASAPAQALADGAREAQDRVRRGGQAAYEALRELPADLAEAVSVLGDGGADRRRRHVWSGGGRAHIEVRGLCRRGPRADALCQALTSAARALRSVHWAEINATAGQLVVGYEEDGLDVGDLLALVERLETEHATDTDDFPGGRPPPPYDTAPAALAKMSLVSDCVGIAFAAARGMKPLTMLPLPVVVTESQPRLRRLLEKRLGRHQAETAISLAGAAAHALAHGVAPLALDACQRLGQLAEFKGRQEVWARRERDLVGDGERMPAHLTPRPVRPVPLPDGEVEKYAERTSAAAVLGAGAVLAWTRDAAKSAQAVLATPPKAARMGRELFCARLGRDLADAGVVPLDGSTLRVLDRVTVAVVDSDVLCGTRPRLMSVQVAGAIDEAEVWGAAQAVVAAHTPGELAGPGPWTHGGWRLQRPALAATDSSGPGGPEGLRLEVCDPEGQWWGEVVVGVELDPLAEAVVTAARAGGTRLHLTAHAATGELLPWADTVLGADTCLAEEVTALQERGEVVLLVSADDPRALAAADVGVAVLPQARAGHTAAHWSADLVCGPGLASLWRVLNAVDTARTVSRKAAHLAVGGSALGALVAAAGSRPPMVALTTTPVYGAAFMAQWMGFSAGRRLAREPLPEPRLRGEPWHALGAVEVLRALHRRGAYAATGADAAGPEAEAPSADWLVRGYDALSGVPGVGAAADGTARLLRAVREELRDPLTPILAFGAAASAAVGSTVDSALVGGVMVGNGLISGAQRMRVEEAMRKLLLTEQVTACRVEWTPDAEVTGAQLAALRETAAHTTVSSGELRVGQVIALRDGDVVPADARLLWCDALEVDESTLTGESVPVGKNPHAVPGADLAERTCMVYEGCTVLTGSAYAVVVATGAQTEAGRAAELAAEAPRPTGIEGHLAHLSRIALPAVGIGGAAVTALGLLRGLPVREALASGVAVAVAAVPEGLPLVATMAQSAAAHRLSRYGILTRSARVLEALGRVDVVCYDKTGTLTEGRLSVTGVAFLDGDEEPSCEAGQHLLGLAARACPQPEEGRPAAHATDQAVLDAVTADAFPDGDWQLTRELPFEARRGYSASAGKTPEGGVLAVKGAPEMILERCEAVTPSAAGTAGTVRLDAARRRKARQLVDRLGAQGLRVLAVAERPLEDASLTAEELPEQVTGLTLRGFLAISDTPRPGASETLAHLQEAGVRVTMITGDHPVTAGAIAARLGIPGADAVVTGAELDALPESERIAKVLDSAVFARVSPEHKVRIVKDLQRAGRVVAMTGDGVNDAAAIKLADIGIGLSAPGSRSAGAAADLVLTDPSPENMVHALLEGRALWRRVRDAVGILVGGNAGEVAFTVLGTALSGRAPLGTRQLLLVNLLTDMLPALALAMAPGRGARDEEAAGTGQATDSLARELGRVLAVRGTATALGAVTAWQLGRMSGRAVRANTMGLAALVGTQLGQTLATDWRSPLVLLTGAASTVVLAGVIQTPGVSHFFGCTPLGPVAWTTVAACSTAATVAAALAPGLLARRAPAPVAEAAAALDPVPEPV